MGTKVEIELDDAMMRDLERLRGSRSRGMHLTVLEDLVVDALPKPDVTVTVTLTAEEATRWFQSYAAGDHTAYAKISRAISEARAIP